MLKFLNQPFPIQDALHHKLKISSAISLFVFLFLLYFRPFGLSELENYNRIVVISGFGFICFFIIIFNLVLISKMIQPSFVEERWKVYHQILWVLWVISTIATGDFFYDYFLGLGSLSFNNFISSQIGTLSIAIFPVSIGVLIFQIVLLKKNLRSVVSLNKQFQSRQKQAQIESREMEHLVILKDENNKNEMKLSVIDLLYVASANNYVEVIWKNGNMISKKLLRNSLNNIQESLKDYEYVFRCHRAFIVNLNNVNSVTGNSQGYKLVFENINLKIPVARRYSKKLKEESN